MSEPMEESSEAPSSHGGLNVVDFPKPGLWNSIRKSVHLLPPGKRRLMFLAAAAQISLECSISSESL